MKKPRYRAYKMRANSIPARALAILRRVFPQRMTSSELAAELDVPAKNLPPCLQDAVAAGVIHRDKTGPGLTYGIGKNADQPAPAASHRPVPAEPADEAPAQVVPWAAALWLDGELALHGLTFNAEGVAILSADQTRELAQLLKGVAL
jgi:hypothetical protein